MRAQTNIRINMVDIKDYFSLRANKQASNVTWNKVKHLNTHLGCTVWQLFAKMVDYDSKHEPCLTQIEYAKVMLHIKN